MTDPHPFPHNSASPGRAPLPESVSSASPSTSINVLNTSPSVSVMPSAVIQPLLSSRFSMGSHLGVRSLSASSVSAATNQPQTSASPVLTSAQPTPKTASELELYNVLNRANLLQYFTTFVEQGGDDVQQLMEAGDDEFLEIMALVGMASKPLHVRRLQKALQDTKAESTAKAAAAAAASSTARTQRLLTEMSPQERLLLMLQHTNLPFPSATLLGAGGGGLGALSGSGSLSSPSDMSLPFSTYGHLPLQLPLSPSSSLWPNTGSSSAGGTANIVTGSVLSGMGVQSADSATSSSVLDYEPVTSGYDLMPLLPASTSIAGCAGASTSNSGVQPTPWTCGSTNAAGCPTLTQTQIDKITECAIAIAFKLKQYEPKLVQNKKKISNDLLHVMKMEHNHPDRLNMFRKYAAIYGRFDAKRKADKPLTLHEVSVNEAAAQICLWRSALLTRRDELFPLARQCVKDAGYHYVKGAKRPPSDLDAGPVPKRATPANSVGSSGGEGEDRSQTPSSCAADTPPPTMAIIRRTLSDDKFIQQSQPQTSNSAPSGLQMNAATNPLMLQLGADSALGLTAWTRVVKHEPTSPPGTSSLPPTPTSTAPGHGQGHSQDQGQGQGQGQYQGQGQGHGAAGSQWQL